MVLSDVDVLWDCSCSTGEQRGPAAGTRPARGRQGLLLSFSGFIEKWNVLHLQLYRYSINASLYVCM